MFEIQDGSLALAEPELDYTTTSPMTRFPYEHKCKNPQQNTSKPNPATHKKDDTP